MKKISFLLFVLSSYLSFSQCTFPVANMQTGTTLTFCVDNPNNVLNTSTSANKFVRVNVVKGFQYTFSVGNVYTTLDENINVYDGATNAQLVNSTGVSGATVNWTATFSGDIKIVVSQGACVHTNTSAVALRLELTNVGNTFDDINAMATDTWVGHVYNWVGTSPPPGGSTSPVTPQSTYPYQDTNYVGYYNVGSETILENFGGNGACFPVLSDGVNRTNIYTEVFAVRYRMVSTRPAGCYIISMRGDDGIRLYNDGNLVFSEWKQQGPTNYNNVLVYLDGNAELIFDFYEYGGQNVADLSIQPFDTASNTVATPANTTVCNNVSPGVLDGSSFIYNGGTINPTITFQWQVSTDNVTFTNITGATSENYTPAAISNAGPSNIVRYYRRLIGAASSLGSCSSPSNSIMITTSPSGASTTSIAASAITCTTFTANWNAIANATSYVLDVATTSGFTTGTFVAGYSGLNVGNVTNLNITGLSNNTTYYYRVRVVYACGTSGNSASKNVTTTNFVGPVAQPATAINCDSFTANWSAVASATGYFIDVATTSTFTAGTFIAGYENANVGNITTINITNVYGSPVYYRIRAVGACGISANSNTITLTRAIATWNGTTWSTLPTIGTLAVINGNYDTNVNGDFKCCSLTINTGFTLNIAATNYVLIQNNLTVNGTLNVLNTGSLVQVNDLGVNTGNISYQRTTTGKALDYVYWSSPVAGVNTPSGLVYSWSPTYNNPNGGQGYWIGASNSLMQSGVGYIMRDVFSRNFTGTPFNGVITTPISRGSDLGAGSAGPNGIMRTITDDNWNLVGNPYASAISINSFLTTNTNIEGFVNVWSHGTSPSATIANPFYNSYVSNYTASDYITFNGSGNTSGPALSPVIGSGQGFMVIMNAGVAATESVTFNNSMRNLSLNNSQFYRNAADNQSTTDKSRIWLDLETPSNSVTRTLVAYLEDATMEKDRMFDAITSYKSAQNLYTLIDSEPFTIQGRATFDVQDRVPVGFKTSSSGTHVISIATVDGLFENGQNIYLEDKTLGIIHDLKLNPYSFTATSGVYNDRFELRYTNETLGNEDFVNNSAVSVATSDVITVFSTTQMIQSVQVYNILGQLLVNENNISAATFQINSLQKNMAPLLVQATLQNGAKVTKKVIF